ncbi:MAG: hypothetical protein ACLUKN_17455 [Bacilli bacterium]
MRFVGTRFVDGKARFGRRVFEIDKFLTFKCRNNTVRLIHPLSVGLKRIYADGFARAVLFLQMGI